MTLREELHQLVDGLPQRDLRAVKAYLNEIRRRKDLAAVLRQAPIDDEPVTKEDLAAIGEGEADFAAGRVLTAAQIKRKYRLR